MANIESIPEPVATAENQLWTACSEAQAFITILEQTDDESPFVTVSSGVLNRLTDAWMNYHLQVLKHGVPPIELTVTKTV